MKLQEVIMLCKNCKMIEMRVVSVEGNNATHTCRKCGYTVTEEIPRPKEDENKTE